MSRQAPESGHSDFVVIAFRQLRRLEEFNSTSVWWDPYCRDVASALDSAEQEYLQTAIATQVTSRSVGGLHVLDKLADELVLNGFGPDILMAPIEAFVEFMKIFAPRMDFREPKEQLTLNKATVKVFWSHRYAPSNKPNPCQHDCLRLKTVLHGNVPPSLAQLTAQSLCQSTGINSRTQHTVLVSESTRLIWKRRLIAKRRGNPCVTRLVTRGLPGMFPLDVSFSWEFCRG